MPVAAISTYPATDRAPSGPLTPEHRRELSIARDRSKAIRATARVAAFNGWTTAIIAAISALFSIFSPIGLALSAGLAFVAINEFRGRKKLLNFDSSGATLLAWNQIGFLAMIVAYCTWMMYSSANEVGAVSAELKGYAELDNVLRQSGGIAGLVKQVVMVFYGGVIALSALFQGGTAIYYFSRRRRVEEFVATTPEWVREVQRDALPA